MAEDAAAESPKRNADVPLSLKGKRQLQKKAKTEGGTGKRGRPKGSKNKTAKKPKGTGKRGRPAKNAAKEESPAEESAEGEEAE